ncbi:MAG: GTPase HflX [Candidatus Cloacimonadota bacterium]|nr:GTPase HflX [Candidatus Cloacimonadota bacterium]
MQSNKQEENDKEIVVTERDNTKAIIVGICLDSSLYIKKEESMKELKLLADTAGITVVETLIQRRKKIDRKHYVGKGYIKSISETMEENKIGLLIFDNELSPSQGRNILEDFKITAIDRTELILRIFHNHAKSIESRMQVRLAELKYELPRLKNKWAHFEKQRVAASSKGSAAASRGMGEKQSEIDRRRIKEEISKIERNLNKVLSQHETQAKQRNKNFRKMCLVGYTNAGKSTLFNAITESNVYVKDQLFATLDTTTKSVNFGKGRDMIISDTIGFVANLPHHLVASFRATLKEVLEADLLLHIVDISDAEFEKHINDVDLVLKHIEADEINQLIVFNKIDVLGENDNRISFLKSRFPKAVFISAKNSLHLNDLKKLIDENLNYSKKHHLLLPHSAQKEINRLHILGRIFSKNYVVEGLEVEVELNSDDYRKFEKYEIKQDNNH